MRERSLVFDTVTLSDGFFSGNNRVNCASPFDGGRLIAYGTNDGVYFSNLWERNRQPVRVLALMDVTQVDVLEEYQLLIVLSGLSNVFLSLTVPYELDLRTLRYYVSARGAE